MNTFVSIDRTTSLLSFNDAVKSNDIPSIVASASSFGATAKNKAAAFAFSFQALGATLTSLSGKIQNNV